MPSDVNAPCQMDWSHQRVGAARVAERARAERRERALPDGLVVGERGVRVAGERDGVREGGEGARGASVVVAPGPAAVARVLRVRVLEVEEGLLRVEELRVRGEELLHSGDAGLLLALALVGRPVSADERVAVDLPVHDGRERLVEDPLPVRLLVGAQDVLGALRLVRPELLGVAAVAEALVVVVAVDEEALHVATVRRLVVREHLEPGVRHVLELVDEPLVGDVAHDHHGVHALRAEPFERVDEGGGVVALVEAVARGGEAHVDVAHHAEREFGLALRERAGLGAEEAVAAECAERSEAADEPAA